MSHPHIAHVTLSRNDLTGGSTDKPLHTITIGDLRLAAKTKTWKAERVVIKDGDEEHVLKDRSSAYAFMQETPILMKLDPKPELATDGTEFINAGVAWDIGEQMLPDGYSLSFKAGREDGVIKSHVTLTDRNDRKRKYDVATASELREAIRHFIQQ